MKCQICGQPASLTLQGVPCCPTCGAGLASFLGTCRRQKEMNDLGQKCEEAARQFDDEQLDKIASGGKKR